MIHPFQSEPRFIASTKQQIGIWLHGIWIVHKIKNGEIHLKLNYNWFNFMCFMCFFCFDDGSRFEFKFFQTIQTNNKVKSAANQ